MSQIVLHPMTCDPIELEVIDNIIELNVCETFVDPSGTDYYKGPYEVDPIFSPIVLATQNKTMIDDVLVKEIRVSTTTNPQGGNTVYIGGVYG